MSSSNIGNTGNSGVRTVRLKGRLFASPREGILGCIVTSDSVEVRVTPLDDGSFDADIEVTVLSVPAVSIPPSPITPNGRRLELLEREVRHLARMIDERFETVDESIQGAHDRLQLHDQRLTEVEKLAHRINRRTLR